MLNTLIGFGFFLLSVNTFAQSFPEFVTKQIFPPIAADALFQNTAESAFWTEYNLQKQIYENLIEELEESLSTDDEKLQLSKAAAKTLRVSREIATAHLKTLASKTKDNLRVQHWLGSDDIFKHLQKQLELLQDNKIGINFNYLRLLAEKTLREKLLIEAKQIAEAKLVEETKLIEEAKLTEMVNLLKQHQNEILKTLSSEPYHYVSYTFNMINKQLTLNNEHPKDGTEILDPLKIAELRVENHLLQTSTNLQIDPRSAPKELESILITLSISATPADDHSYRNDYEQRVFDLIQSILQKTKNHDSEMHIKIYTKLLTRNPKFESYSSCKSFL